MHFRFCVVAAPLADGIGKRSSKELDTWLTAGSRMKRDNCCEFCEPMSVLTVAGVILRFVGASLPLGRNDY